MEWRKILLACTVLYCVVSAQLGKLPTKDPIIACDDSARPVDDVTESTLDPTYMGRKAWVAKTDEEKYYSLLWKFQTPSDIDVKKEGSRVEMNCESGGEIKGTGEVIVIKKGSETQFSEETGGSKELDKDTEYTVFFEGEFDKTPTKGDSCDAKIYVTLNDEEKSYCTTSKVEIN